MTLQIPSQIAEIELRFNYTNDPSTLMEIRSSSDAFKAVLTTWNDDTIELIEECKLLILNRANRLMGIVPLSKGGTHGSILDTKLIFAISLKAMGASIILVHNHPSHNLVPSKQDLKVTKKLQEAGQLLDLPLIDHLIITPSAYYSFADEGIL